MPTAAIFEKVAALVERRHPDALRIGLGPAFHRSFIRDGVLHARRPGVTLTVAPVGQHLEFRTWGFIQPNEDLDLMDLAAETRMMEADRPDLFDRVESLRRSDELDQVFEISMLLAKHVRGAQMAAKYPTLMSRIPGLRLREVGGVAPFWAEGDWDGYRVTFRAHQQTASLKVLSHDDSSEALWIATATVEEPHSMSILDNDEFAQHFLDLAQRIEVAPFPYRFEDLAPVPRLADIAGRRIPNGPFVGWGHSPEEARAFVVEQYQRMYPNDDPEQNIGLASLNEDNRNLPPGRPAFLVLPE